MVPTPIPRDEAAQALAEVRTRHDRVVTDSMVPTWFWSALGLLMVGFIAAVESQRPALVATGSVAYVVGLAALIGAVAGRRRAQVRNSLIGVRGGLAIAALTLVLVAAGLGLAFGLAALGVPYPATFGGVIVGAGMAVGGPLLMRYLHTLMSGRAAGGAR